jgi:hypothetical protein
VQKIGCEINGKVAALTIDSGCEGNCVLLETCLRLGIEVLPLDPDDRNVPTQADGKSPLEIVGQATFKAVRGKVEFFFVGYVAKQLNADILCGGPFMETNKLVQELHNKRIIIDGKYIFLENSPFCPNPIPNVSVRHVQTDQDIKPLEDHECQDRLQAGNIGDPPDISKVEIGTEVPKEIRQKLMQIHEANKVVFDGDLSGGYNGASGNFDVNFNFRGGVPPPPHYHSSPPYFMAKDEVLLQAKIDSLEEQGVVVKVADADIIPRYAAPCMLGLKNSVRNLAPGEYEKLSINEKIKYNRFILCHNKLSDHIEKQPAKMNTIEETTRIVGSFEYVITSDLKDSFWQRHVTSDKLQYMAFHSPFRGAYIFLRSTQGLINQSEGLEELLSVVLQDCIMSGWCRVLADNLYVLGHSHEETVKRWQLVLQLMLANNLKLSPKKTACFPEKLDLLGWTKQGKYLIPDPHRQSRLAEAERPGTVRQLRSYLGGYRQFYRCKEEMSSILRELEELVASKKSSEKLTWTEQLMRKFEESKLKIKELDKLYLPRPDDQLVLTSDWSEQGISATLWAMFVEKEGEESKPKVVARFSAKLPKSLENLLTAEPRPKTLPCDGEMSAVYVAVKSPTFSSHMRASTKRTISLVDNKPVVEAAALLKRGKFSSSRVINSLMTGISDHSMDFQHISGKLGQNFPDDFASRNPASCDGGTHCKICSFVKDCQSLTVGSLSFRVTQEAIIGHVHQPGENLVQDILTGAKSVPFSNRKAMRYLQDQDEDLLKLREYLTTGKRPNDRNTRENKIKRYLREQNAIRIAKDGCLVAHKRDRNLNDRELVVIPEDVSMGLLYGMHINLNHPTTFQLMKVVDTRFFILDREQKIRKLVADCTLCQSVAKIPVEIHNFKPNEMPNHPGQAFTVDILKMSKKIITVTVDNFSGFVSTTFTQSEKQEDLLEGIITTVSPFKATSLSRIRVDQAPGFKALFKKNANLRDLGIELELGECKNKNKLALADKKMQELEIEIKKAAPSPNVINVKILARATAAVNEKIRHQGLSAKEIMFARDQFTQENLKISDEVLAEEKMEIRKKENVYSAKAKASNMEQASPAGAVKGNIVFLKDDGSKHEKRDLYLVVGADQDEQSVAICKLPAALSGTSPAQFQPHNITYKVNQTDIFLAPNQPEVIIEDQQAPQYPGHDLHQRAHGVDHHGQVSSWQTMRDPVREEIWEPVDNDDSEEDDDVWTEDEEDDGPTKIVQAVLDTLEHLSTTIDQNTDDENPDSTEDTQDADDEGPDTDEVVMDLFSIDNLHSASDAQSVDSEEDVDSDFGKINFSLQGSEQGLARAGSLRSLDWDNYASDPTYSQENASTSILNTSERELRQSFRHTVKARLASEKSRRDGYNLRPRQLSSFSYNSDQDLTDRLAQHSRVIHPGFDVDDLSLSSSTASDVFELEDSDPPPLPPRNQRSASVMMCNRDTCKPKNL